MKGFSPLNRLIVVLIGIAWAKGGTEIGAGVHVLNSSYGIMAAPVAPFPLPNEVAAFLPLLPKPQEILNHET